MKETQFTTQMRLDPFDVLFRDLFDSTPNYNPAEKFKTKYPLDIYESNDTITLELACSGLIKEDIKIEIEGDLIKLSHLKSRSYAYFYNYFFYRPVPRAPSCRRTRDSPRRRRRPPHSLFR